MALPWGDAAPAERAGANDLDRASRKAMLPTIVGFSLPAAFLFPVVEAWFGLPEFSLLLPACLLAFWVHAACTFAVRNAEARHRAAAPWAWLAALTVGLAWPLQRLLLRRASSEAPRCAQCGRASQDGLAFCHACGAWRAPAA